MTSDRPVLVITPEEALANEELERDLRAEGGNGETTWRFLAENGLQESHFADTACKKKIAKLQTAIYPSNTAPFTLKLCQNDFHTIPHISFFDTIFFCLNVFFGFFPVSKLPEN